VVALQGHRELAGGEQIHENATLRPELCCPTPHPAAFCHCVFFPLGSYIVFESRTSAALFALNPLSLEQHLGFI
jgi:hypothetical protein